jgi:hypothetical protein
MQKTILATSLALLFNTTVNYAETKIPKQTEVEKAYNKKWMTHRIQQIKPVNSFTFFSIHLEGILFNFRNYCVSVSIWMTTKTVGLPFQTSSVCY